LAKGLRRQEDERCEEEEWRNVWDRPQDRIIGGSGMKLEDVRQAYEDLSGKASDIVRQLSLAGLALVWLFHAGSDKTLTLDKILLRAAIFYLRCARLRFPSVRT